MMINTYSDDEFINDQRCEKTAPDEFVISPTNWHDLNEYYKRHLGPAWYVHNKQSTIDLLTVDTYQQRGVIFQQQGRFYVFVKTPDISKFRGCGAVNEIIPKAAEGANPTIG